MKLNSLVRYLQSFDIKTSKPNANTNQLVIIFKNIAKKIKHQNLAPEQLEENIES